MSDSHRSIGEVLSLLLEEHPELTISKIRFLESQGLISPQRTPSGYRKFFPGDVERLDWILSQQRDHFLPLKEIKRRLAEQRQGGVPHDGAEESAARAFELDAHRAPARRPDDLAGVAGSGFDGADEAAGTPARRTLYRSGVAGEALELGSGELADTAAPDSLEVEVQRSSEVLPAPTARAENRPAPVAKPALFAASAASAVEAQADPAPLDPLNLTLQDLAEAAGADVEFVAELHRLGLIVSVFAAPSAEPRFDEEASELTKTAAALASLGLPARSLRMFKVSADREAGVYEQVLAASIARGDPAVVRAELSEILDLTQSLRQGLLRRIMRPHLG